ncbi:hypothetical protein GQX73_g6651 [Xylaria multiplex]|uniref:EGF-like domain-containing protein n=1 Tax=Xylaria multiplex TaxID=323545 RepID=A0A7C8MS20_9PEZI|nr:hypothetical protein GQX73_g6651 [Xylaria multiplex]
MDESSRMGGSVKRAREQAQTGSARALPPSLQDSSTVARRPQAPAGRQLKDGTIGVAISRPTPVPQWPLAGPIAAPMSVDSEPYRPPPGRSQPPQRPPRPSVVPSILDSSRVQDPTPTFQYVPQTTRTLDLSTPETPVTQSSRPSTFSSVGSIPDFPLPVAAPNAPPPRRSVNLGPPPSSRRGASSFYSTASFVSPIPEESPRIRSHTSYASSAAIPESFGSLSPGSQSDMYFDEMIAEESFIDDDADDSRLVRSASIGKRGKPSLVTTKVTDKPPSAVQRPAPKPIQGSPFSSGTGYIEGSSSSSAQTTTKNSRNSGVTTDSMLNAFESASATVPSVPKMEQQLRPSRLSGLRRPPRLDIDAVRTAEARGSLTSLPDLIRRATRLASLMDRGTRPASRFDDLDFPREIYGMDTEKNDYYELDKHQSGLSDMLAAFPPPASRRSMRQSVASWPLPRRDSPTPTRIGQEPSGVNGVEKPKGRRRCCGFPLWGFLLIVFLVIAIIVAAVVIPVELVVNKKGNAQPAQDCMQELPCANGGTSVVSQGVCSCICSNGFIGKNCTTPAAQGCTTTTLETEDATMISNVTIGQAIPRLVLDAQTNFSIPLDATSIISKFSSAGLSCSAENALVTFDGRSLRTLDGQGKSIDLSGDGSPALGAAAGGSANDITLTLLPGIDATITLDAPIGTGHIFATTLTLGGPSITSQYGYPTIDPPFNIYHFISNLVHHDSTNQHTQSSTTTPTAQPTGSFTVTDNIVDFARVAVLFVLQEKSVDEASVAQNLLQTFFKNADSDITPDQARNITIGDSNSVDLVNLLVDEANETAESPVIPLPLTQNFPQQSSQSATGLKGPELEKWKSRVPKTGNSPLVPKPLFSSAKCIVEVEQTPTTSEAPIATISSIGLPTLVESPISTNVSTIANPTPISPSPSLFPTPPSTDGIVASPMAITWPASLQPSNSVASRSSVYSQSTIGNAATAARPRPVSSVYSQNTLTTVSATATSSPRTPTMTNWVPVLPGLPNASIPPARTHAQQQSQGSLPIERVIEEELAPQQVQTQIQVPRLRSPSLPQDRGNRRRTLSSVGGASMQGRDRASISSRPLVQSPEPVLYPEMSMVAVDYEGSAWPLQKPSVVHNSPQKHYVCRSQGSNIVESERRSSHVANKESITSSFTQTAGHHEPDVASPRVSIADSHTPICGPGEQRSGWWTDEEDAERGRANRFSRFSYAAIGMKEKPGTEAQSRRARRIKIIVGALILAILIIVGVAVGVTLGVH